MIGVNMRDVRDAASITKENPPQGSRVVAPLARTEPQVGLIRPPVGDAFPTDQ